MRLLIAAPLCGPHHLTFANPLCLEELVLQSETKQQSDSMLLFLPDAGPLFHPENLDAATVPNSACTRGCSDFRVEFVTSVRGLGSTSCTSGTVSFRLLTGPPPSISIGRPSKGGGLV